MTKPSYTVECIPPRLLIRNLLRPELESGQLTSKTWPAPAEGLQDCRQRLPPSPTASTPIDPQMRNSSRASIWLKALNWSLASYQRCLVALALGATDTDVPFIPLLKEPSTKAKSPNWDAPRL